MTGEPLIHQTRGNVTKPANVMTARGDLAGLDALSGDTIGVFCFSDVRPLRGVAGFLDWRLCGQLSHAFIDGHFSGVPGEVLLLPTTGRLGQVRIFVFGLGPAAGASEAGYRAALRQADAVLRSAGAIDVAFAAPQGQKPGAWERDFVRAAELEFAGHPGRVTVLRQSHAN